MTDPAPAIFFDDGKGMLAPLRDLRPVSEVRTGALTARERLCRALDLTTAALFAQPPHEGLLAEPLLAEGQLAQTTAGIPVNTIAEALGDAPVTLINGRCPLPLDAIPGLEPGQGLVESASGDLIAARLPAPDARRLLAGDPPGLDTATIDDHVLMTRPWHARTFRDASIEIDLGLLARDLTPAEPAGCCLIGDHPVLMAPDATVFPACILDTSQGPIAIGPGATVRPGATIIGPVSIGAGSTVLDKALIKGNTAVGPVCKVAGEVGGTVIQGYSNKGHDGHLGDSWLGEWVNLGAGTTNSNLLNTYAEVTSVAQPGASREKTGETFFGCVLADHVKTAIGTRIMTGSIVHTGAMWAASAPVTGCVDRFTWATDAGVKAYRVDRFLDVMRTSMGRRKIEPGEHYTARVRALSEITR